MGGMGHVKAIFLKRLAYRRRKSRTPTVPPQGNHETNPCRNSNLKNMAY
jgi:hypothetical protein